MQKDSARLTAAAPLVEKTVNQNGAAESKRLKIANWGHELGLFTASDINKPSWRGSYNVSQNGDTIIYKAKTPELKTRELSIVNTNGKLKYVNVKNHVKNVLFEADEKLRYMPDSIYEIEKIQHVLLLGTNTYLIKGRFVK